MDLNIHEDLTTIESISPFLKQCVGKGKEIPPGSILQVQQVTNVSFPTYDRPSYDADKHILKITVTDGKSQGYALVADSCPGITSNTPPGTKITTTQCIPVQGSLFVLTRNNCEVIGGRVAKLFEKWEVQKRMAIKHEWGYTGTALEGEGPPPWKPFGFKPSIDVSIIRKMKTTDVAAKEKDGQAVEGEKSQFDLQRDEAISELQAAATNKQFQKPKKHLLDKEITDIMEEGFSQEMAEFAMRKYKNSQKALKFLKDSRRIEEGLPREAPKPFAERKDRRKKGKAWEEDEDDQHVPREFQRPNTNVSLFGFLQGHIKTEEKPTEQDTPHRELEDGMGRLNMEDSRNDSYQGRNDRGGRGRGRGRGGFRGRGGGRGRGGWDRDGESFQQQRDYQSRPARGMDRSYGSDYHHQQEYQKPQEYQVPPQNCPETFPELQDTRGQAPRQYFNNNTDRHEKMEHSRYNWQHRGAPHDSYPNHSSRGYRNPSVQYQNSYQEGWNPPQSQGYARPNESDMGRGRGGGGGYRSGSGRGGPGSSLTNYFNNRSTNNMQY